MPRRLPEGRPVCCPACLDVELRVIAAPDGARFLACEQCLRRFAVAPEQGWTAPEAAAFRPEARAGAVALR